MGNTTDDLMIDWLYILQFRLFIGIVRRRLKPRNVPIDQNSRQIGMWSANACFDLVEWWQLLIGTCQIVNDVESSVTDWVLLRSAEIERGILVNPSTLFNIIDGFIRGPHAIWIFKCRIKLITKKKRSTWILSIEQNKGLIRPYFPISFWSTHCPINEIARETLRMMKERLPASHASPGESTTVGEVRAIIRWMRAIGKTIQEMTIALRSVERRQQRRMPSKREGNKTKEQKKKRRRRRRK